VIDVTRYDGKIVTARRMGYDGAYDGPTTYEDPDPWNLDDRYAGDYLEGKLDVRTFIGLEMNGVPLPYFTQYLVGGQEADPATITLVVKAHLPGKHNQKNHAAHSAHADVSTMTRKQMLDELDDHGYTGPTSYTKKRLGELVESQRGGADGDAGSAASMEPLEPSSFQLAPDAIAETEGRDFLETIRHIEINGQRFEGKGDQAFFRWVDFINNDPKMNKTRDKYVADPNERWSVTLNQHIREGKTTSGDKAFMKDMDEFTESATCDRDLVCHRATVFKLQDEGSLQVGAVLDTPTYKSIAPDRGIAKTYLKARMDDFDGTPSEADTLPMMMKVYVPAGTTFAYADQGEFVLGRNKKFEILSLDVDEGEMEVVVR